MDFLLKLPLAGQMYVQFPGTRGMDCFCDAYVSQGELFLDGKYFLVIVTPKSRIESGVPNR